MLSIFASDFLLLPVLCNHTATFSAILSMFSPPRVSYWTLHSVVSYWTLFNKKIVVLATFLIGAKIYLGKGGLECHSPKLSIELSR
nr:MAG TPA: hypothetical protein [Caudoviricetes sp.]